MPGSRLVYSPASQVLTTSVSGTGSRLRSKSDIQFNIKMVVKMDGTHTACWREAEVPQLGPGPR